MLKCNYFKYFSVVSACCASDSGAAVQDGTAGLCQDQAAEHSSVFIDQLTHGSDQNLMAASSVNSLHCQPSTYSCKTLHGAPLGNSSQCYHIRADTVNINYNNDSNSNNNNGSNDNVINNSSRESSGSQYSVHVKSEADSEPHWLYLFMSLIIIYDICSCGCMPMSEVMTTYPTLR